MIWCYSCNEEILLKTYESSAETKKSAVCFAQQVLGSVVDILNPPRPDASETSTNASEESDDDEAESLERAHKAAWEEYYKMLLPFSRELQDIVPTSNYRPGLCGLRNIGNTCYMNSALQALLSTTPLRRAFLGPPGMLLPVRNNNRELQHLLDDYYTLVDAVWTGKVASAYVPKALHGQIGRINPLFRGYAQHDSQELLRTLLDSLHEILKRKDYARYKAPATPPQPNKTTGKIPAPHYPEESFISDIFEGKLLSTVTCGNCHRKSNTTDRFFDLSLSLPSSSLLPTIAKRRESKTAQRDGDGSELVDFAPETASSSRSGGGGWWRYVTSWFSGSPELDLESCLHGFCLEDELTGQDRYRCEHCKVLHDATKSFSIAQLPQILCLHIKRFRYDLFGSKVSDYVRFPLVDFDMTDFCASSELVAEAAVESEDAAKKAAAAANEAISVNEANSVGKKSNGRRSPAEGAKKASSSPPEAQSNGRATSRPPKGNGSSQKAENEAPLVAPVRTLYDLYAVICHSGSLHGGHYYAYAKHPGTGHWYEFNDSSVSRVDEETVASAEAYVLFYEKQIPQAKTDERERVKAKIVSFLKQFEFQPLPPGTPHVSLTWLNKWLNTNEPGPMNAPALTCEHNLPKSIHFAHQHAMPLPQAVADDFRKTYGGALWYIVEKSCAACQAKLLEEEEAKREVEAKKQEIAARRVEEYAQIEKLGSLLKDPSEVQRGYYFIDLEWINSWLSFVKGQTDTVPGHIDNSKLNKRNPTRKHRVVNTSVWEYLLSKYGGGPVIWSKSASLPKANHPPHDTTDSEESDFSDSDSSE